jgi:GrpB-like predicted nucleotidyltransferase (UPF0157 family)
VIVVVPYDPAWPAAAAAECAALASLFPRIEHFGSTAVPGLAAKPVIDLMACVSELDGVDPGRGYRLIEIGMRERLFFRRDGDPAFHLHVVTEAAWDGQNERMLRDHLAAHPDDARRYAELKLRLAADGLDGDAYTRAKTELIQELTDRARAARGLPSVPVWEE